MPVNRIDHVDLAVRDVERSLAFYLSVFGPLGVEEAFRFPTYRGTENVVYLRFGAQVVGFRAADGGEHRYYEVGLEHLAFVLDTREELDELHQRCVELGVDIQFPPQEDRDIPGYWEMFIFDPDGLRIEAAYYAPGVVIESTA
jgi:catechol 2,3-dioxygenase-like lactoylglutathione lyase family enzyme